MYETSRKLFAVMKAACTIDLDSCQDKRNSFTGGSSSGRPSVVGDAPAVATVTGNAVGSLGGVAGK